MYILPTVRTGVSDHLRTLDSDAQDCLRSYVLRVVVHKVSQEAICHEHKNTGCP